MKSKVPDRAFGEGGSLQVQSQPGQYSEMLFQNKVLKHIQIQTQTHTDWDMVKHLPTKHVTQMVLSSISSTEKQKLKHTLKYEFKARYHTLTHVLSLWHRKLNSGIYGCHASTLSLRRISNPSSVTCQHLFHLVFKTLNQVPK